MHIETRVPETREFLGLDFTMLSMEAVVATLRAVSETTPFRYVVTPNVDHMVRLADERLVDPASLVIAAYDQAWLRLCDSRVLAAVARRRGVSLAVVPGSDLTVRVLDDVVRDGDALAVVGGSAAMIDDLRARYPGRRFLHHVPPMGMRADAAAMEAAAEFVAASGARFVFLAVGSPQQELLAQRIAARGDARGCGLCIGASIDFVTGRQRRAPRLVQRLHLEWAHRLLQNPRRMWRRYLIDGPRIFALARAWRPHTVPN